MYLLGLRALGHEVFYVEDTGECIYDPSRTRAPRIPRYGTALHPRRARAVRPRRPLELRQLRRHVPRRARARRVQRFCADADLFVNLSGGSWFWRDEYARIPRQVFVDSRSGVHAARASPRARRGTSTSSAASITCSRSAPTSARRRPTCRPAGSPGTRRGSRSSPICGAPSRRRAGDRFTHGHDVEDRELHRRGRQQGPRVREVHRPARAHAAPLRAGRQRPADAAARARLGRPWTRWASRGRSWDYRDFIQGSKGEFGVAKHAYVAHRSGWFSDRTECYLAAGRPALVQDTGWSAHLPHGDGPARASRRPRRRSTASTASPATTTRHARRRRRDRRATASTPPACCRGCWRRPARDSAPLRIAQVAPVATSVPPPRSGSIETMTALLTDGLVAARPRRDALRHRRVAHARARCTPRSRAATARTRRTWPWELCELFNLVGRGRAGGDVRRHPLPGRVLPAVAAVRAPGRRADGADAAPRARRQHEVALWSRHYPDTPFVGDLAGAGAV